MMINSMMRLPGAVCAALAAHAQGFIRAQGTTFVDADCKEFVFAGWNSWDLAAAAAGAQGYSNTGRCGGGLDAVECKFKQAAADGLLVVRLFGHGISPAFVLQPQAGQYNEAAFRGLDKVLDAASRHGVKVILTLADTWLAVDGKPAYLAWCGLRDPDDFYTSACTKRMFIQHMAAMAGRRNSVNGRLYRDDAAIFAWDLLNEPRCDCWSNFNSKGSCTRAVDRWVGEMAAQMKQLAPKQMVTVGEEGFFGTLTGGSWTWHNPNARHWKKLSNMYQKAASTEVCSLWTEGGSWGDYSGQDFVANHGHSAVDFAAIHMWPDNWATAHGEFASAWVEGHVKAAEQLGKPLVFEEFGRSLPGQSPSEGDKRSQRNPFFKMALEDTIKSVQSGRPLKGALFWQWDADEQGQFGPFAVQTNDATYSELIRPHAQRLRGMGGGLVGQCVPGGSRSFQVVPNPAGGRAPFLTAGTNLVLSSPPATTMSSFKQLQLQECLKRCAVSKGCGAVRYNRNQDGGSCQMLKEQQAGDLSGAVFSYDASGWQTYHYAQFSPAQQVVAAAG